MTDPTTTSNEPPTDHTRMPATASTSDVDSAPAGDHQRPRTLRRNLTRRSALAGVGLLAASSLSGCLGLLGAEPVAADQPRTTPGTATPTPSTGPGAGGSDGDDYHDPDGPSTPDADQASTPEAPTSLVGPGVLPADVEPEEGRGGSEQWQKPDYRAWVGPLTAANHGLQDVTITNTPHANRKNSPLLARLDLDYLDEPVIESDGTFTITGALHYTHACGYYGINYLDVVDGEAIIALAYTIDETTCTPEHPGRLGARYGPITITGKLDSSMDADHLIVTFLSGVHDYKLEESGGDWGGPWRSVANWHFHI
ncbi:hypothetical protein [Haloarchaeobius baliensis]|uniref:hypothetical protein n=1 Tax=Haloarchaeobius baliensis TaxID=1670458 RepID=UPI003F883AF1